MKTNSSKYRSMLRKILFIENKIAKEERPSGISFSKVLGSTFVSMLIVLGVLAPVYSQVGPRGAVATTQFLDGATQARFSCDNKIYASRSGSSGLIREITLSPDGLQQTSKQLLNLVTSDRGTNTIAIGKNSWNGRVTLFGWENSNNDPLPAYLEEGESQGYHLLHRVPRPVSGVQIRNYGGEVFQRTGELYFSGRLNAEIPNGEFGLAIMDPVTGAYTESGALQPVGSRDVFGRGSDGRPSSDMAIDAEGNFYIVVGRGTRVLTKVERGASGAGWKYSQIMHLPGVPGGSSYGMAFLNGGLYMSFGSDLHRIDVLTGRSTLVSGGSVTGTTIYDLAACQTAPVIRGTVYADEAGNASVSPANNRIAGQDVEIWKEERGTPVYKSTVQTNEAGEFSLLVDTISEKYYVRLVNPKGSDGRPAVQTWSGADPAGSPNGVTSYCMNRNTGITEAKNATGLCLGAHFTDSAPGQGGPDQWAVYSSIQMTTDEVVAVAEFALSSAANYADAPTSYNNGNIGPSHTSLSIVGNTVTNNQLNVVHLGKTVSTAQGNMPSDSADNIPTHDGVEVALAGSTNFRSLQDFVFVTGEMYDIRINVEGAEAERAYLSAWLAMSGSRKTNNFESGTVLLDNRQLADGGNNGYVIIRYRAPEGLAVTTASYARFRVSSVQGLTPTESSTATKIIDGEVEDYRVYFVPGEISIATKTLGGTGSFSYNFSNILSTYPSTTSSTIDVLTEDTEYYDSSHHVFNQLNNAVVITQTSPATNWTLIEASCQVGQQIISGVEFTDEGNITIPAQHIVGGSQISCVLTNSLGPRLELIKSITDRDHTDDQFIVQIKDNASVSVVHAAETVGSATTATTGKVTLAEKRTFTLTEIMANGDNDRLKRYDSAISCINNTTSSGTVLPTGDGQLFEITPVNGDDITCTITNTPIKISTEHSKITAEPSIIIADGETLSTVTVHLYKDNGDPVTVGGDADRITIFFIDNNHIGEIVDETAGVVDNDNGSYSVKVRSSNIAENEEIGYRIDGNIGQNTATVSYIFGEPSIEHSTIEVDSPSIEANGEEKATLTVRLFDENGNAITSSTDNDGNAYDIQIVYVDENNKIDESVLSTTTHPNNDGSFIATVSSVKAGLDKFTFKIRGEVSPKSVDVTYIAGAPSVVKSSITANPVSILADGIDKSTFKVQLYDAQGNIVTSNINPSTQEPYNIKIVYADAINKVGEDISETTYLANGTFTATVVSKASGKDTFTFEIEGSKPDTGNANGTVVVAYGAGEADTNSSKITILPKEIKADGVESAVITVTLFDRNNNQLTSGSDVDDNEYEVVVYSMWYGNTKSDSFYKVSIFLYSMGVL